MELQTAVTEALCVVQVVAVQAAEVLQALQAAKALHEALRATLQATELQVAVVEALQEALQAAEAPQQMDVELRAEALQVPAWARSDEALPLPRAMARE